MRSPSEVRENGKKGGIASGIARRKKKTTAELINTMLSSHMTDKSKESAAQFTDGLEEDDLTNNVLLCTGLMKAAASGNIAAFDKLQAYQDLLNILVPFTHFENCPFTFQ